MRDVRLRFIFLHGAEFHTTVPEEVAMNIQSHASGVWAGDGESVPSQIIIVEQEGKRIQVNLRAVAMIEATDQTE